MAQYQKINDRLLTPEEVALYTDKSGQRLTQWDKDKANAIIDSLNAKEQGVQPTPASSATQGTYLNPSYGNVTQTGFRDPLQKSKNLGAPTVPTGSVPKDAVQAQLDKAGKKPTLPPIEALRAGFTPAVASSTDTNRDTAAQANQSSLEQKPAIQANISDTQAEQAKTNDYQRQQVEFKAKTQGTGVVAANETNTDIRYPVGQNITDAAIAQGLKDHTLYEDPTGKIYRARGGKWETQPHSIRTANGTFKPVPLPDWTNAGGVAYHGSSTTFIPGTPTATPDALKKSATNPASKIDTFISVLAGKPASYMTGQVPFNPNTLQNQGTATAASMTFDIATAFGGGTILGSAMKSAPVALQRIAMAGLQTGIDYAQVLPMYNEGYIKAEQIPGLVGIYGLGNFAGGGAAEVITWLTKTGKAVMPAVAPLLADIALGGAAVGSATYYQLTSNGMSPEQARFEAAKITGITVVTGLGFHIASKIPQFAEKTKQAIFKATRGTNYLANPEGVTMVEVGNTGVPQLDKLPTDNGTVPVANKDIIAIMEPVQAKNAVERIAETVKAGNPPEVKAEEPKPDIPAIQAKVAETNTTGIELNTDSHVGTVIKQNYEAEVFKPAKTAETDVKLTKKETEAKIKYVNDIITAADAIGTTPKKLENGIVDKVPKTIEKSLDNSVTDKINNTTNPKNAKAVDKIVSAAELEYVKNDIIKNWEDVYGADAVPRMIDAYNISAGTTVDDGIMKAIAVPIMENINGKKIKTTLEAIYEYNRIKMSQAATSSVELATVENTPPSLPTAHKAVKGVETIVDIAEETEERRVRQEIAMLGAEHNIEAAKPEALPTDNSAVPALEAKAVEPAVAKPVEDAMPPEVYDMPDNQMDEIAIAEVAKETKMPKVKKAKNSTNLTDEELAALDNMSTEEINNFYMTKNKPKWIKEFQAALDDEELDMTWDDFVDQKINEAYGGTMLRANYTQAGVGVALMLPELFSDDSDNDDPTKAGMETAMFLLGAAALGAGTVAIVKYRANARAKIANEKLGYRPEAPKSISDSRAVNNPDLYYPGKTAGQIVDIANKASKVQNAVIPKTYIFRNSDANIFLNTDAILRDHPQYQGLPWGADPRQPYIAKQLEETNFIKYKNMVLDAELKLKNQLSIDIPGTNHNQRGAILFRYAEMLQSDERNAAHLPKTERQVAFDKLNSPDENMKRIKKAANSFADGIPNLTDAQARQLFNINPFFMKYQKALQYNDIRLSCKQTFGVEYENIGQVTYEADKTLAEVKLKERPLTEEIHAACKELENTTDIEKQKELKRTIRAKKKVLSKLQQDALVAKRNKRGVENLKASEKSTYVAIIPTAKKDMKIGTVIREVKFDEETATYKNTGVWDNNPIKMIGYAKTEEAAQTMAKETIIAMGVSKNPLISNKDISTTKDVFIMGDGRLVSYRTFELDPLGQKMFNTKKQVNEMVFKILNNGTDGFDLKFIEGVASLRKDVLKQIEDVMEVADDGEIESAIASELQQNNIDLEFLATLIADKDNIKFAENYVRKNLMQMLKPGLLNYRSFDFDPINYYSMSAKDITSGVFDVGMSRTNKVESGLVNNAVSNVALDQLQWQNNMGIDNNYTSFLKNKIDHSSAINQAINKHTTLAKWSSATTSYLASQYLAINPISALKNEIAGGAGYALTEFNYASSLAGSTYNLAKGFAKNQYKAIAEVKSDFSVFNPKAIGEVADPYAPVSPLKNVDNPFLKSPERLLNTNKPLSYIAGDNPLSTYKAEANIPYKPIISDKELYQMTSDAIHVSNIYNEDPVSASDIQGVWRGIGQVSFVGMKATEMHLRAFTAFVTADKILREIPFKDSGFATPEEYVRYVVDVAAATTEAAHGRYNLYDLAPFVRDIAGNWLGHNALLLIKPALNMSLNWIQAIRKTGVDLSLADTPIEKRKVIFKSVGRLTALMGEMVVLGGVKAIPLVTEAAGILATWNIMANDGKWSATQQTAIEKLELKVRGLMHEAGLSEWQIDTLKKTFYYSAFSTLVGVNLSMNEGWASYFEPVTLKAMQKLFKDLGKAEKSGDLFDKVGMIAYQNLVPNQLKRITLMCKEFGAKKRLDKDFNEIGGELTTKEAIIDGIAGKMLSEVDNTDSMYKFLNATDTDAGKQEYWLKLIKAPNIAIKNVGYLADFTDNAVAMSPELLKNTKYAQIAAYKADQEMTEYETTSREEVQSFIDADLALGEKSTLRAWAEYGKLPDELKGGNLQSKLKRAMDWSNQYYQSEIAFSILQGKAQAGAIIFDKKAISPSEITFDMPDAVKNAPDALKGFEYFKYKLEQSMGKVERGGQTKPKKSGGKSNFNADGEYVEPKEYEYKEPQFNE